MFETLLIKPLYNGFIYLIGIMPGGDAGLAIIVMTFIVRVVFYPAFAAQIRTTLGMQAIQGEVDEINKKYKDDAQERARRTLALYKEKKIRPFANILAILIQLPVLLALYFAFFREGLPQVADTLLYPFVATPEVVSVSFFGLINLLSPHNIALSLTVGVLQYFVARLSMARIPAPSPDHPKERHMAHRVQKQMMLYFLPVIMAVVSYTLPAAVGLYFAAGSVFSLGQEWFIKRQLDKKGSI